jgi:copper transport protein
VVGAGLWLTAVLRWLLLTGLSVALGGVAGRGLARQLAGSGPVPLPGPWALRASLLGMLASAGLAVQAGHGMLATRAGLVAVIELVSFAVAAVLLRLRRSGLSTVALAAVAGAEGFRAHPERIIPVGGALLTCAHLVPAAMWTGMLCYTVRAALAWRADTAAVRRLVRLYARAAAWLFTLTVVTGVTSALVLVPIHSLLTTSYGRVLIIKAAVVAVAAGLAVGGRRWLRAGPGTPAGPALATRLEAGALIVVLAVTALLTVLGPPRTRPLLPAGSGAAPQTVRTR